VTGDGPTFSAGIDLVEGMAGMLAAIAERPDDENARAAGQTAAHFNAGRMPGARYTKSFNTLTSAFQAQAAGRQGEEKIVQWLCGDDADAKQVVAGLITDAGFVPVDLGGTAGCAVMEAPRRPGAVYGEEYRAADAPSVVDAVRAGQPIPPTPHY